MNSSWETFEHIANDLVDQGYSVADQFLLPEEVVNLLKLEEFKNRDTYFKRAGVGKHTEKKINQEIRGDYIQWIDNHTAGPAINVYLQRIEKLIQYLNQHLFLSLKDVELHLTIYPAGSFYQRHLDQFKGNDHRKLSVILYLNEDWKTSEGGQLRMHLPQGNLDVFPISGRLVCFRSDKIEHEVLPAMRDRLSLTGWILDQLSDLRDLLP